MITMNGMQVTEDLVNFLKQLAPESQGVESSLDSEIDSLLDINDYLLEMLTNVSVDDVDGMKTLSNHLINIKSVKDHLKKLNLLLKKCTVNSNL